MFKQKKLWFVLITALLLAVACAAQDDGGASDEGANNDDAATTEEQASTEIPEMTPTEDLDPDHPMTEAIQYGEEIFNETNTVLEDYVGNELSCQSCHADGGLSASSTLVGVVADYPQYRPREGVAFTLEDRINGCMIRSMNGEMLPYDSEEMRAMMAYFSHISEGVAIGEDRPWFTPNEMEEIPEPDVVSGEELYESKNCMTCHGDNGEGTGANTGPALWGENSFNDGAGLTRLSKMAGYIQNNMPIGDEYILSDQEAADLAAYILMQERPVFENADKDFPHTEGPDDFIRGERLEKIQNGEFDWKEEIGRIVDRE
ncbi:MAG TPA: c-type cytochrome [Pseudogracilibacillus sp.]|nr:c-type cytochrome [Pseudogracilibacillus sp.]